LKKPLNFLAIPLAVFLVVSALFLSGSLERLELLTIDLRYWLSTVKDSTGELPVAVVTLDQNSLKGLGRWPIRREQYIKVLDNIIDDGAISVLIDVDFSSPGPDPGQDSELARSVERAGNVVMAAQMDEKTTGEGVVIRNISLPYPALRDAARALGSITFEVDPDGVVRRMPPVIDNIDEAYLPLGVIGALMIDPSVDTVYPFAGMMDMRILASDLVTTVPFLKVSQGEFPVGTFRDRVVLLGATSPDLHDLWLTPLGVTPGVFIQTAVLDTTLNGAWYERQGRTSTLIMLLLASLVTGWLMGKKSWKGGAVILGLSLLVVGGFSLLAAGARECVQIVPLLLVCLAMYPVQIAARAGRTDLVLARERRKTEAFLSISELQAAEEGGQETYLVPLVLLGQILNLARITVCLMNNGSDTPMKYRTIKGNASHDPPMDQLEEVVEKGVCVTTRLAGGGEGILVPMATVRKVMGALYVESTKKIKTDDEDIRLLLSFATQTAYFLESHALDLRVKDLYVNTIRAISRALDSKDQYTSAHSELSLDHVERFGTYCGLGREQIESLHAGALLHDIGKIGVPDSILAKEGNLSEEEFEAIRKHPDIGADIVLGLPFPEDVKLIIKHHHERFDGKGYPDGLKGEEIPLLVRIFSILDVYEALVGFRPYRDPVDAQSASDLLKNGSGTQFDPVLLDLFIERILSPG
jgi:putative nucleotidyltransferase with HDIG domain